MVEAPDRASGGIGHHDQGCNLRGYADRTGGARRYSSRLPVISPEGIRVLPVATALVFLCSVPPLVTDLRAFTDRKGRNGSAKPAEVEIALYRR
jgi:hypothetical protein